MCRLLGFAAAEPTTLADLLGEQDLSGFTEMSVEHMDGWGMAWAADDGVTVAKAPDPARTSGEYARLAASFRADTGFVHLRQATKGLAVRPENTHPFTDGRHAFGHNGRVVPPAALDPLISERLRGRMAGDTDSERYYLAVLSRLPELGAGGALAAAAARISQSFEYTSLNAMLVTPTALHAVCQFDPAAEAAWEQPEYFRLRYKISDGAVVVASTGWGAGWNTLSNGELLTVERRTLTVTVQPVSGSVLAS